MPGCSGVNVSSSTVTWTVGMSYTIIDANTTAQVAKAHKEEALHVDSTSMSRGTLEHSNARQLSLDSAVQRRVQENVAEIDSTPKQK
jgi:hypothetical protein